MREKWMVLNASNHYISIYLESFQLQVLESKLLLLEAYVNVTLI
jgi:hypothetical protein